MYTRHHKIFFIAIALVAVCVLPFALSGCKKQAQTNVLSMYIGNPSSIDPFDCKENYGTQVCTSLFDGLLDYDSEAEELVPRAASSWESSADAKTFTFHLVEGATFSNGEPVTSASFKRGWERVINPHTSEGHISTVSYHMNLIEGYDELLAGETEELAGVECPDDYTLVVHLTNPYADFPYVTVHPALSPVPSCALDDFDSFFREPIGNGPFKMDGPWVDGQRISLVRNDSYYGEKPQLDGVDFIIEKDIETAYREFKAGNIDVSQVPLAQTQEAKETYGVARDGYTITPQNQFANGDKLGTTYLNLNMGNPKLQDVDVRRALSLAINREAIVNHVLDGSGTAADNIVPPSLAGYEEQAWAYSVYDPDEANKLLDAKYPRDETGMRDLSFSLLFDADANIKSVMEQIQSDLQDVGIEITLEQNEHAAMITRCLSKDYEICQTQWLADYPILDNYLYPLFFSASSDNHSGYNNKTVDTNISLARALTNTDARIKALQAVNKEIASDVPAIPLYFQRLNFVGTDDVKKLYIDPSSKAYWRSAEAATQDVAQD